MRQPLQGSANKSRALSRTLTGGALLLLATGSTVHAAPDGAELIAGLARVPPAQIEFLEVRSSALLTEPIVVGGTLEYAGRDELDRRVERPYRESTTVRGETVYVEREGEPTRTFSLKRSAELRGLLTAMLGLLRGDGDFLDDHFTVDVEETGDRWRLDLAPTDGRLRQRLRGIIVAGEGHEPLCFVIDDNQGGASVMLLGTAAADAPPLPLSRDAMLARCAAE